MTRRIAIIVNYRSEHGGLHDHVADQVGFARNLGYDVTLACPPCAWATGMSAVADVVETDFADRAAAAQAILARGRPDIIHAHPAVARETAFELKRLSPAPLLVTYHGSRPETLSAAEPEVDIAVTVSDLTRRFILKRTDVDPARVVAIPNAVDTATFAAAPPPAPGRDSVLFASRWDDDKRFVVDLTLEAIAGLRADSRWEDVDIVIAGDGSNLAEIEAAGAGRTNFRSLGWLDAGQLAQAMGEASVVVSPGRGALQAISVGRATVALGSKGYVGFLAGLTLLQGIDANFGSGGIGPRKYPQGLITADIAAALQSARDVSLREAYSAVAAERTLTAVQEAHARIWGIAATLDR